MPPIANANAARRHLARWSMFLLILAFSSCISASRISRRLIPIDSNTHRRLADSTSRAPALNLNTLTTSCNGGCAANAPCIVVGQSSLNAINCVNDTRCTTLQSGQAALCLEPFQANTNLWWFEPARVNDSVGVGPFERVGLVQPPSSVQEVVFAKAEAGYKPLPTALDISSLNLQPSDTLKNVTFQSLNLAGLENANTLTPVLQINIHDCNLTTIPAQMLAGESLVTIDMSNNKISDIPSTFASSFPSVSNLVMRGNGLTTFAPPATAFPQLQSLDLRYNFLTKVPSAVFKMKNLKSLYVSNNPINASRLTNTEFAFLAGLETFDINGTTPTSACPPENVVAKLNTSFTFCTGSGSGSGGDITVPVPTPIPITHTSNRLSTGWIVAIIVVAVLLIALLTYCICRRRRGCRDEVYKPTRTSFGSFVPMDHYVVPPPQSAESSGTTTDYPPMGNLSFDDSGELTMLSYDDVFFQKLLRVSPRSELWLGRCHDQNVVIKRVKASDVSHTTMRAFVDEAKLMTKLHHPQIAALVGTLWDSQAAEFCVVVEYVPHGSLRDAVTNSGGPALPVAQKFEIARQTAEAIEYLHDQQIVHGRVTAFNILLDQHWAAKLSIYAIFHYVRLSPLDAECCVYAAPEVRMGQQPTEKADVYAFGVFLVELDTQESPATNHRRRLSESKADEVKHADVLETMPKGFTLSHRCPPKMKDLITACVEPDAARRPSMRQVVQALTTTDLTV